MPTERNDPEEEESDDGEPSHKYFTPNDDSTLIEIMRNHPCPRKQGEWAQVSREFGRGCSARQLQERWNNFLRPGLNHDPFTAEERRQVLKLSLDHPRQWQYIAREVSQNGSRSPAMVKNLVKNLTRKLVKKGFQVDHSSYVDCLPDRFFLWGFPRGQKAADLRKEYNDRVQPLIELYRRKEIAGRFSIQALMATAV
jgi:hypothetical protein